MRKGLLVGVVALALAAAGDATGAPERAAGTLQVDGTLITTRSSSEAFCSPGTPPKRQCFRYVGEGAIPGLGRVTSTYTKLIAEGEAECEVQLLSPVIIEVAGRGTLQLSRERTCWRLRLPVTIGPLEFAVTGSSGRYAGATGGVTFTTTVFVRGEGEKGASMDSWKGMLAAPGADFDVTPPTISGAVSKTVRVPKRTKRVRVQYSVTAADAVDGAVPVACAPRSGTIFKLGRTTVRCTATDASGNVGEAQFRVTVSRR